MSVLIGTYNNGAGWQNSATSEDINYFPYTATVNGLASSASFYGETWTAGTPQPIRFALYASNGTKPTTLLAKTNQVNVTTPRWYSSQFTVPYMIVSGTSYFLALKVGFNGLTNGVKQWGPATNSLMVENIAFSTDFVDPSTITDMTVYGGNGDASFISSSQVSLYPHISVADGMSTSGMVN